MAVCGAAASVYSPVVVGTIYGPLIDGGAWVGCDGTASISMVVGLYEWTGSSSQGIAGIYNGVWGSSDSLNTYAFCSGVPWSDSFQTAVLFAWDGSGYYGATSFWTGLGCALD